MYFYEIIVISINCALAFANGDTKIKFPINDTLHLNSHCLIKSPDNLDEHGICTTIDECLQIDINIRELRYNHTVCGYEGTKQIVCCPWRRTFAPKSAKVVRNKSGMTKIDLDTDYKCVIQSSGQSGVLKFIENCPELHGNINAGVQNFCNHEICTNLVCCPLPSPLVRYNQVCASVDRPDSEIMFRLNMNTPCTVNGLNVTGTYQEICDSYDRNEILEENVLVVCQEQICVKYYCCPILKPTDVKRCKRRGKAEFPLIEFIGPSCTDSLSNLPGRCRDLNDCPAFRKGRQKFDECGQDCCTMFYCCPDDDYEFQSISKQKCYGYKSAVYRKQVSIDVLQTTTPNNTECSPIKFPYAGGLHAEPGLWPHMVALGYIAKNNKDKLLWNCGGSLISEKFVLTAAHCLITRQFGQVKIVRLGSLYLDNITKSDECAEDFGVKRVIPHPSYNRSFVYNDIGLIELDRDVKFNFHARPICLPTSDKLPYSLIGMGWGYRGPYDEKSETLYYGYLEPYTYEDCNKSYAFNLNRRVLNGIDNKTQFCVGSQKTIESTCSGDSGGPLIWPLHGFNGMAEIHGITSFGTVCGFANSPGVNTRVYPYVNWIESVAWSLIN